MLNVIRYSQIIGLIAVDGSTASHLGEVEEVWLDEIGQISYLSSIEGYLPLKQVSGLGSSAVSTYGRIFVNPPMNLHRLHRLAVQSTLGEPSFMLLHVLSVDEEGSPYAPMFYDYYPGMPNQEAFEVYQKQWDRFKHQGQEMLRSLCAQANTAGVNSEFTQNLGSPGPIICDLARSWGADLIVNQYQVCLRSLRKLANPE